MTTRPTSACARGTPPNCAINAATTATTTAVPTMRNSVRREPSGVEDFDLFRFMESPVFPPRTVRVDSKPNLPLFGSCRRDPPFVLARKALVTESRCALRPFGELRAAPRSVEGRPAQGVVSPPNHGRTGAPPPSATGLRVLKPRQPRYAEARSAKAATSLLLQRAAAPAAARRQSRWRGRADPWRPPGRSRAGSACLLY